MKRSLLIILASVISGALAAVAVINFAYTGKLSKVSQTSYVYSDDSARVQQVSFSGEYPDFTYAAESCVKAVVFVKVKVRTEQPQMPNNFFEYFFGYGGGQSVPREQVGSGSGVIIREDGYIVTNNHVVNGASEIEVTMDDGKSFKADLIGTDPVTDVALIKIDAQNLPTVPFGDSDKLRLGEWVIAIGSPYGLTSTITAGIVSAKGRSLADNREFKIESFIQTDAAVNPGNSGGALVNIRGELVGINTAIYSNTGSYAGCSFAVPVNMAKKVVEDLMDYGSVQRGMLGISMINNSAELAAEKNLSVQEGVYIAELVKGGAAAAAGVKEGDVLTAVNGEKIKNGTAVQEIISRYRPGDKVTLSIVRGNDQKDIEVTLIGKDTQELNAYNMQEKVNIFGAELAPAPKSELEKLNLKAGVKVTKVEKGKMKDSGIKEGFIITYVNNSPVFTPSDIAAAVKKSRRSILLEGLYSDGSLYYYGVGIE